MQKIPSAAFTAAIIFIFAGSVFSAGKGPVTIRIGGWSENAAGRQAMDRIVSEFNKSHDSIQVEYAPVDNYVNSIIRGVSNRTAPDVFYVDANVLPRFVACDSLLPIDPYLKGESTPYGFFPSLVRAFTFSNRLYGLPKDFSCQVLAYNKAVFDRYQVACPGNDETYYSIRQKMFDLRAKGMKTPLSFRPNIYTVVQAFNGRLFDEKGYPALDDPGSLKALELYKELFLSNNAWQTESPDKNGPSIYRDQSRSNNSLLDGGYAMEIISTWQISDLRLENPALFSNLVFVEMPAGDRKSAMLTVVSWSIGRHTGHPAEAFEVLKYLATEGQKIFAKGLGVYYSLQRLAGADEKNAVFYRSLDYGSIQLFTDAAGDNRLARNNLMWTLFASFQEGKDVKSTVDDIRANYPDWLTNNPASLDRKMRERYFKMASVSRMKKLTEKIDYLNSAYFKSRPLTAADFLDFIKTKYPGTAAAYPDLDRILMIEDAVWLERVIGEFTASMLEWKIRELQDGK